jgi:hypothetical protein
MNLFPVMADNAYQIIVDYAGPENRQRAVAQGDIAAAGGVVLLAGGTSAAWEFYDRYSYTAPLPPSTTLIGFYCM